MSYNYDIHPVSVSSDWVHIIVDKTLNCTNYTDPYGPEWKPLEITVWCIFALALIFRYGILLMPIHILSESDTSLYFIQSKYKRFIFSN